MGRAGRDPFYNARHPLLVMVKDFRELRCQPLHELVAATQVLS